VLKIFPQYRVDLYSSIRARVIGWSAVIHRAP
jgi:hypothetical protein